MKKQLSIGFLLGLVLVVCVGAVVQQTTGLYILNSDNGETKLKIRAGADQTANIMEITKGDTALFSISSAGVMTGNGSGITGFSVNATNTLSSLTVNAAVGSDGVVAAIRRSAAQTANVFEIQTEVNGFLFGVSSNGIAKAPTYRTTTTNNMVMTAVDGSSWLLRVAANGTISAVTNSLGL